MNEEQIDIVEEISSIKKCEKSIITKLSILFGISTLSLLLSVVFMSIGGGKFSSKQIIGLLIMLEIVCVLLSLGFLAYHLLADVKKEHYEKYYKYYDIIQFILLALVIFLFLQTFIFKNARVNGSSMDPTLHNGDIVFVMQIHDHYKYNDVVVMDAKYYPDLDTDTFEPKPGIISSESFYVKRIKATPNQKISYEEGTTFKFYVDDVLVAQTDIPSYISILKHIVDSNEGLMPKDKYLLLGDNALNSKDSRVFGLVDKKDILGIVKLRFLKQPGLVK
ncbi:MAG: signal peptidase I [Acholeplasmataceae bacterium]